MTGSGNGRAGFSFDDFHFNGPEAPVPATLALLGLGLIAMGWMRRRSAT
jgi:hypothetical protein